MTPYQGGLFPLLVCGDPFYKHSLQGVSGLREQGVVYGFLFEDQPQSTWSRGSFPVGDGGSSPGPETPLSNSLLEYVSARISLLK